MKLYYNRVRENARNISYPYEKMVCTIDDLRQVVAYDHVCAKYQNGYRKKENFVCANCTMLDIDNADTEDSKQWVEPIDVRKAFQNVPFYIVYSRNHMKEKNGKKARPKFHVYFQDVIFKNSNDYEKHKKRVCDYFPAFDQNAKDSARFFFGVENPEVEFYEGDILLFDFMKDMKESEAEEVKNQHDKEYEDIITEGTRNNTLFQYALKVLKRLGDTSKAYENFIKQSQKCIPLLEEKEISDIWKSALKYYNEKIKTSDIYICSNDYHTGMNHTDWELPPKNPIAVQQLYNVDKKNKKFSIAVAKKILEATDVSIRLNDMSGIVEVNGLPPKYQHDNSSNILGTLIEDIANTMSYKRATERVVQNCLDVIANENHYHPVIELITKEKWDGTDRLSEIYQMLNLSDDLYKSLVRKWAIQTIALLFNSNNAPISAEGVLVLQGNQGIGKTQFFRHLALEDKFFKGGATLDMGSKDCLISALRVWICELGEIDSTTKKEQSALKAFLTESTDRFRTPYARNETVKVRKTSFCGTVNPKQYLHDETGNRRYWTIPIEKINLDKIFNYSKEWYVQFWRQILEEYRKNPKGYLLVAEEQNFVNKMNSEFEVSSFGEDEFLTCFDIESSREKWKYKSATEIADILNEKYKKLRITGSQIGKILNKIEPKLNKPFERKIVKGKRLTLCPPLRTMETDLVSSLELPEYKIQRDLEYDIVSEESIVF